MGWAGCVNVQALDDKGAEVKKWHIEWAKRRGKEVTYCAGRTGGK